MAGSEVAKTVKVTVNDLELDVPAGELIVETVKRVGQEIPVFCYHPRMKAVGMCRMCLVDVGFKQPDGSVRMMPKPQAGCTLPASDGMVVYTDSENVHRDRKGVLEFLLVNHPLDCPICDRGGECPLQNNTLAYGPSTSRFVELKRHLPKAFPLSRYVTLDLERCIQCGRCVRFTEEISGESELAFRFRGAAMQPSTFKLTDFESKFSGNVIEICPVGALTSSKYRFRARPWDLETTEAVCTECSNGCSVWFDHRAGRFVRVNGRVNEDVNEEWTCDKGKFGHDYYNSPSRLTKPLVRRGDSFHEVSWGEAYEEIAKAFERPGAETAALTGPRVANEGLFLLRRLFADVFGSQNIDHRWTATLNDSGPKVGTIAGLEQKSAIFVFGTDLAEDLPILYLRVRKAATLRGARVVTAYTSATETDVFAEASLHYKPGAEAEVIQALAKGNGSAGGVDPGLVSKASGLLGPGAVILASDRILSLPKGEEVARALAELAASKSAEFNLFPTGANDMGADLLGLSQGSTGTWSILEACRKGAVKALWLCECDPSEHEGGVSALEACDFVVYQGTETRPAMSYASVVLPMAAPSEQEGTWTNCEGRIQRIPQAIGAPGEAKPAWRIFSEMLLRLKPATPFFNPGEVLDEIRRTVPAFAGLPDPLPAEGAVLGRAAPAMSGEAV